MPSPLHANVGRYCANLQTLYREHTTASDKALGSAWYPTARAIISEWSESYAVPVKTVACVIAAISPQIDWERNLVIADDVLADRAISIGGALHANIAKARRILADNAEDTLMYFPHGPKVASFARNLWGDSAFVTVDGHAAQAALNDVLSTITLRWAPYVVFAECYARVAGKLGYAPSTFQAIIWHTWKRLHPRVGKIQNRKRW